MKLWFVIPLALLSACANKPPLQSSQDVRVVGTAELPPPERSDLYSAERPYFIGPYDKLRIDVYGLPELSGRVIQVDASGRAAFPLAGEIAVSGKSPSEVSASLTAALRAAHIRDPQVTVNLEETVSQVVTVDGEVREPGLYPVVGRMTLMRTVARARGLGEFADQKDVVVFRTVNGQHLAALYDIRAIRRGIYADPEIFANDVVVVGDSKARRLFRDIISAATIITTPLIIALQ